MYCSNCGKELEDDALFCQECGQEVKTTINMKSENRLLKKKSYWDCHWYTGSYGNYYMSGNSKQQNER